MIDGALLLKGLEGSRLYKIGEYYYIYSTYGGWPAFQTVFRSKDIYGPYEEKKLIDDDNIHQGALVETQICRRESSSFCGIIPCMVAISSRSLKCKTRGKESLDCVKQKCAFIGLDFKSRCCRNISLRFLFDRSSMTGRIMAHFPTPDSEEHDQSECGMLKSSLCRGIGKKLPASGPSGRYQNSGGSSETTVTVAPFCRIRNRSIRYAFELNR